MTYEKQKGIPKFGCTKYKEKSKDYVVLIPIINEGKLIIKELKRVCKYNITDHADIVIGDGGSTDRCTKESILRKLNANTLLIKKMRVSRVHSLAWNFGGHYVEDTKELLLLTVTRVYPKSGKTPTKISAFRGNV